MGDARRRSRWASSSRAIATYWVKTSAAPPSARIVASSSSSRSSLPDRPGEPHRAGLLEELRRVVADLLQPGEQREHQAAAGVLVGALDALHRVAHDRLVEDDLLAGQAERVVGLGLGRQLGRDARVGLAAAQQERADQVGELAGLLLVHARLDRRGPDLAEGVAAAEQAGDRPVEDRPQLGQVVLDGRAGQGDAGGAGDGAQRAGGRGGGFLTCCASSATTSPQSTSRSRGPEASRGRGRSAACRRSSARTRSVPASAASRSSARAAVEAAHGRARREPLDLALPVAEQRGRADDQRRAGPAPGAASSRCRCRAISVMVLPRPMSSARQQPRPSEVSWSSQVRPRRW